ncbi:MAG: ABC transporter substrate-binding protein [Burkholderiales bacterium]|nr:ABC transporter substrate-binding protein [Burkholderiales bacterium]
MMWRDAVGTQHQRAQGRARIVSLVPSITELVCELGLAEQLVGRTGFCVHPREILKAVPKVGGTKDVDLAKVRALAPTHVLLNIDENDEPTAAALARFVPHLIVTHPLGPMDNPALFRLIGGVFGVERMAEALCAQFLKAHDALSRAARAWPRERVLYLIWKDPWMSVSRDTYISRTLALAGWDTVPVSAPARYPKVELDETLLRDAERILLSSEPYRFRARHVAELRALPFMRGKTVALIDGEMTSWYGNRAIAGMDYLRRFREEINVNIGSARS